MKRLCLLAVLLSTTAAWAQTYQAVVLPEAPGHAWTLGTGAGGGVFAGYGTPPDSDYPGRARAVLFTRAGFTDVTPAGYTGAIINDSDAGLHGGGASLIGGYPAYAFLWNGTQPVNLHPSPYYTVSEVLGVGNGTQSGYVFRGFQCSECGRFVERHAALWTGSAASFQLLHSRLHSYTSAWGTDGVQQVGQGEVVATGDYHALLWNGPSTIVAVDLHPSAEWDRSLAIDVRDGQQVGSVSSGDVHAALWTGSAQSFVDLNPAGYCLSDATAVRAGLQTGLGSTCAETWRYRALAWRGTAASAIDLHALLPAEFQSWNSRAEDIDADGNIVGFVEREGAFRPVIWYRQGPRRLVPSWDVEPPRP